MMIGKRIKRARLSAGMSLRDAAAKSELSAMAISKFERSEATPTSKTLLRLSRALQAPVEFFLRPDTIVVGKLEYRKRSSLGKKQLARIEADIFDQMERFLELLSLFPNPPIQSFVPPVNLSTAIDSLDAVEDAAAAIRDDWQLGRDGIASVADTLEEHGVFVLTTKVNDTQKFDGLSVRVNGYPVVVVGADWPGDRQRFTLAHELGHLVLEGRLANDIDEEKACNRFAGAFLVPKEAVVAELGEHRNQLGPRELYQLKHEYGLSMMGWVFRARDVGVISNHTSESLMKLISIKGWRTNEPGEQCQSEAPHLFEQLVARALAESMVSMPKAAELMSIPLWQFRDRMNIETSHVATHQ